MNILWIDHASRVKRHDKWLHTEFAKKLNEHVDHIYFYAPAIHNDEPKMTPIHYDPKRSMADVVKQLKIDVIIVDTRSACYHNYFPKAVYPDRESVGQPWLPKDFNTVDCLKICIEEDYHYIYILKTSCMS